MESKSKQELYNAILTYIQTTGSGITKENQTFLNISNETIDGCKKFYELYVKHKH